MSKLRRLDVLGAAGFVVIAGLWSVLSPAMDPIRLPSIATTLSTMWGDFLSSAVISTQGGGSAGIAGNLLVTVLRALVGVSIGALLGLVVGLLMAHTRVLAGVGRPVLEVLRVVPSLVAAPFLVLWFGTSQVGQVGLVIVYTMLVLQFNTFTAVRNLPPEYARFAASLGASRARILRTVTLPAILPELIGGIRVALQLAWGLEVVAELIGAQRGIGRMMASANSLFRTDIVIAGVLWLGVVAVLVDWALSRALFRFTSWHEGSAGLSAELRLPTVREKS
jgi:ABC-type nitrate/sulfonate/bicarbonate transport system permease component